MEAGFLKRSSASFCSFRFFVFLLNKMSPLGEKLVGLLKSKRVRYLLMKNSIFAQINTQML